MAGYAAQLEQYQKAVDIYEQVGTVGLRALLSAEGAAPYPMCQGPFLPPPPSLSPLPPFLSTSLGHPLTLMLLTWLNMSSTRGPPGAAPFAQPSPAQPPVLGALPGRPQSEMTLKNQSPGGKGKNCRSLGSPEEGDQGNRDPPVASRAPLRCVGRAGGAQAVLVGSWPGERQAAQKRGRRRLMFL